MIEHMDNFSVYGFNAGLMLNGVWAQIDGASLVNDPAGTPGSVALRMNDNPYGGGGSYAKCRYVLGVPATTIGVAFRLWIPTLSTNDEMMQGPVALCDAGNNILYTLTVNTTGRLQVRSGGLHGAVIAETPLPAVTANGWYHIEFKTVKDAVNGSFEVRVEGRTVISVENYNNGAGAIYQMQIALDPSAISEAKGYLIKDFVIWNQEGTYNNDWMGSVVVYSMIPTADVDLNWTPSVGAEGWPILDNSPPVDTDFLGAPTPPPLPYVCEVNDVPDDVTTVRGIMTMVRAAKTDGGDAGFQVGIISDPDGVPATALGADRPITVAQTYWRDVFEKDPKTNAPFLPSALNAINLQLNRTL